MELHTVGDNTVAMALGVNTVHLLAPSGVAVLRACDGTRDLPALVKACDMSRDEVESVLQELSGLGLVDGVPALLDRREALRRGGVVVGAAVGVAVLGSTIFPRAAAATSVVGTVTNITTNPTGTTVGQLTTPPTLP